MAGKAITRAFLILALIVTAHMIKPFSIKSVTQHVLYSTKSFRFVLPIQLRDNFDHANYLAINLSNSLFEADEGIRDFAKGLTADLAIGPINIQSLDEVNKSATKQKSGPKKSAPAKRVNRPEKRSSTDPAGLAGLASPYNLVARVNSADIIPVEMPPAPVIKATFVPIIPSCALQAFPARMIAVSQPRPLEVLVALRKIDCEKREAERKSRIALIEDLKGAKGVIRVIGKLRTGKEGLDGSDCEERKTAVVTEELKIEIAEPEADVIAPQINEELKASQFANPFEKCSREP
ncbi:MAG TPA: hypothetical protein VJ810_21715 [Blastocatellia bacterium]|nr:hypothetical protein [Blastocatellia bacterium]